MPNRFCYALSPVSKGGLYCLLLCAYIFFSLCESAWRLSLGQLSSGLSSDISAQQQRICYSVTMISSFFVFTYGCRFLMLRRGLTIDDSADKAVNPSDRSTNCFPSFTGFGSNNVINRGGGEAPGKRESFGGSGQTLGGGSGSTRSSGRR